MLIPLSMLASKGIIFDSQSLLFLSEISLIFLKSQTSILFSVAINKLKSPKK